MCSLNEISRKPTVTASLSVYPAIEIHESPQPKRDCDGTRAINWLCRFRTPHEVIEFVPSFGRAEQIQDRDLRKAPKPRLQCLPYYVSVTSD